MTQQLRHGWSALFILTAFLCLLCPTLAWHNLSGKQASPVAQICAKSFFLAAPTRGDPTTAEVNSCVCYPGYPDHSFGKFKPHFPKGQQTAYDVPSILKEACEKLSTYGFGPEPAALEVPVTIENKNKGNALFFQEDILVKLKYWRAATDVCNTSRKLSQEECEADFQKAICDQGCGVGYGKCFEYTLDLNPSARAQRRK